MRFTSIIVALLVCAGSASALAQDENQGSQPERRDPTPPTAPAQPEAQPETPRQHSPDAVAALKFAVAAIKDGFSAQVRTYAEGNALLSGTFPKGEGRWAQPALQEDGTWMVRYTGSGTVMTKSEPIDFDILWQPDRVTWLDHGAQTFNVDRPTGRKSGEAYMLASSAWSQAEVLAKGFADAMNAAVLEMREPAEIDGVACDVVAVTDKPGGDAVLWYFGHDDHLPRRSEIVLPTSDLSGSIRVDFTEVAAGADALKDVVWEIPAPEGYTENIARAFQEREAPTQPAAAPPQNRLPTVAGLPDWEVPDSEGALVSPGALRGKVAVLYFWGTWSPVAKKALPELQSLVTDYAGKPVEVISMAFREGSPAGVVAAAREQGQTWRQVPQADDVVKVMGLRIAPSFVVLGPEGELLYRGGRPKGDDYETLFKDIRAMIDRALAGEPAGAEGEKADGPDAKGPGEQLTPSGVTRVRPGDLRKKDD